MLNSSLQVQCVFLSHLKRIMNEAQNSETPKSPPSPPPPPPSKKLVTFEKFPLELRPTSSTMFNSSAASCFVYSCCFFSYIVWIFSVDCFAIIFGCFYRFVWEKRRRNPSAILMRVSYVVSISWRIPGTYRITRPTHSSFLLFLSFFENLQLATCPIVSGSFKSRNWIVTIK